jgi:hypothetical protein
MLDQMLRPSAGLLGSSRAARRANVRAERVRAVGHAIRGIRALVTVLVALVIDLVLLWALPFVYMAAAYLALDLPARWIAHREAWGSWGVIAFLGACAVGLIGIARAVQDAAPIAPVRPKFAKAMLAVSWVAALLMTIGDLVF